MGFFGDSAEGITRYKWKDEVGPKLRSELDASREKWTLIEGLFHPYFHGRMERDRGISKDELENMLGWLRENKSNLPCRPISDNDIEVISNVMREYLK